LQITEFHFTLYDPDYQSRVKRALLNLFQKVEDHVPEKAEFNQFLKDFMNGRFTTVKPLMCCVPWEHVTQRYDDGKELVYYWSGKPEGLKVPKPAQTSLPGENEDAEDDNGGKEEDGKEEDEKEETDEEDDEDEEQGAEPEPMKKTGGQKTKGKKAVASPASKKKRNK